MIVKEINSKEVWENFLSKCEEKSFLQSWNWGEFNIKEGHKIWRLGLEEMGELMGVALVVKVCAKRATFLFVPHGPVLIKETNIKESLKVFLEYFKILSKQENASFIRVSSLIKEESALEELGFRNAPMHSSAYEATWKLDILPPEAQLLQNMRKTTRYLIKKALENKDIKIEKSTEPKDIEIYQKLNKEVSRRQNFVPFSPSFIKNEFETFSKDGKAELIFGKVSGEVVAGAIVIFWSGTAFYHQAASIGKFSKLSIPYLLQWEAIKEAKKKGCKIYDFWGFTDPVRFPKHPWAGPTLFKMGFGGYKEEYVKTKDFVISKEYWLNYIIETVRKKIRGL